MEVSKMFVPLCFKKDLSKLSERFKIETDNEKILKQEISTSLNAKDIYTILKNFDLTIKKCQSIEYSKQRLKIKEAEKFFKISNSSDVYLIKITTKFLKFFKTDTRYKLLRFYSYSSLNNCYFFLYRIVDEKDDRKKICNGGIIIPVLEKKILVYMKQGESLKKAHKKIFQTFNENLRVLLEVMGKFVTQEELDRLSTVETLDPETDACSTLKFENDSKIKTSFSEGPQNEEIIFKKQRTPLKSPLFCQRISTNHGEEIFEEPYSDYSDSDSIISYGDWDENCSESWNSFADHNKNSSIQTLEMKKKFVIDLEDDDYNRVRKLNEDDLKIMKYYDSFLELKNKLEESNLNEFDENEIIRYIFGWRGDPSNAFKYLKEVKEWRLSYKPRNITSHDFKDSTFDLPGLIRIACQDIYGRPFLVIKAKFLTSQLDVELFMKYLIYLEEKAIDMMPNNIDKTALIIDIQDSGISNFNMGFIKTVRELTSKFYVERLSQIIVINKGFFFGVLWKFVSAFLDEKVLNKIVIIDNSKTPWLNRILGSEIGKIYE
jgi:hypothetical protein